MKKSILTFGLLASVMVLTSSFSPEVSNENIAMNITSNSIDIGGSSVGGNRKVDINGSSVGGNRKVD
ncbi:hypothetical protein [Flavobacterium sp. TAB 87]|uniref:hypothetical protein n=1 Tax=Flavobacterium sp. TAB 87 TaxID=1729581 RepID=UPI00076D9D7E|nr:hypothetical protein [Flavobacterium sp. TAB 87]KVV13320.1 hypothetical protein AP058_02683 [Flavobacterium sp. TAB 87]